MIKVGDRVRVYDFGCEADNEIWDGKVLEISKYQDIIVKVSNGDDDFWVFSKQCRKLIKRNKQKFKVGDRVHAVVKDYNKDIKGTIEKIENAFYPIHHYFYYKLKEDEGWFTENTLKRLIKKKIEFKVGDRVSAKGIFTSYGTIKSIDNKGTLLYVHLDDYDRNIHFHPSECKKLVKKKKESPLISNALLNIVNNKEVLKSLEWAHQDNERWTCCALTDIDKRISMLETFQSLNADRFARIERSIKAK